MNWVIHLYSNNFLFFFGIPLCDNLMFPFPSSPLVEELSHSFVHEITTAPLIWQKSCCTCTNTTEGSFTPPTGKPSLLLSSVQDNIHRKESSQPGCQPCNGWGPASALDWQQERPEAKVPLEMVGSWFTWEIGVCCYS